MEYGMPVGALKFVLFLAASILVPLPGIEPRPTAVKAPNPYH